MGLESISKLDTQMLIDKSIATQKLDIAIVIESCKM